MKQGMPGVEVQACAETWDAWRRHAKQRWKGRECHTEYLAVREKKADVTTCFTAKNVFGV